jgi:hypothetical protein
MANSRAKIGDRWGREPAKLQRNRQGKASPINPFAAPGLALAGGFASLARHISWRQITKFR